MECPDPKNWQNWISQRLPISPDTDLVEKEEMK